MASAPVRSEDELSAEVEAFFRTMLRKSQFRTSVAVASKQQVVLNLTVGRDAKSAGWRYFVGMQQQDIVFYLKNESLPLLDLPVRYHWASRSQIAAGEIQVPVLVCELKHAGNLISHHFITYSKIAEQIRQVYPYCAYYFVVGGARTRRVMPETVLRQAKGFDRVFLSWDDQKHVIWNDIRSHLVYLRDRVEIVPA